MKKIILFAAILFSAVTVAKAQDASKTSSNNHRSIPVNVILKPIQTLFVNPSHEKVDLVYESVKDYKKGVTSLQKNHLTIYSTGAFIIQVNSESNDIKSTAKNGEISASTISVQAASGSTNALGNATLGKVSLSVTPTDLVNSGTGGVDRNFDITYAGMGGNGYVNKYYNSENGGVQTLYSTTVTYTIAAQ